MIQAIPDETVMGTPARKGRGKPGPEPPPPPDVLGPVLGVLIRAAAMTGLRQSELLGLRWRVGVLVGRGAVHPRTQPRHTR